MVINRGEIWWADLAKPRGSEPGYTRPVLVVSADAFNSSRISTVIVLVITSNTRIANAPGNVKLEPSASGLPKPSVVNVSQALTVDKSFLTSRVGAIPANAMQQVSAGMRMALDLP